MICEFLLFTGSVYLIAYGMRKCFQPSFEIEFLEEDSDTEKCTEQREKLKQSLNQCLPRYKYSRDSEECVICMGHEGEYARRLHCGHTFCEVCLFEWFDKGAFRCPLCNQEVGGAA
jgi:hypothetical protein